MEASLNTFSSHGSWSAPQGGPISVCIPVEDESRIGEVRRAADSIAERAGLDEEQRGEVAIVVSEAVTNLARHAKQGTAYLRHIAEGSRNGIEIIAIDSGPGMHDVGRAEVDGYSTGGTSGHGLGAMRRMAAEFDLYSQPGAGTAVVARVLAKQVHETPDPEFRFGVICRPINGESVSGDGWSVLHFADRTVVLMVDGLGHGPSAAAAADVARERFNAIAEHRSPKEILETIHEALRATRGAALLIAELKRSGDGATATVSGVGNITASIVAPMGSKALPSINGTAGLNVRQPQEFSAEWRAPALLILASDGLTTRWRLDAYPGILARDPALAAALLHRDHSRGRDDVTVLAVSLSGHQSR